MQQTQATTATAEMTVERHRATPSGLETLAGNLAVIGRDREQLRLTDLLTAHHGSALLLVGAAGVGTSTTLTMAERIALTVGAQVAAVSLAPADAATPLAGLNRMMGALSDDTDDIAVSLTCPPEVDRSSSRLAPVIATVMTSLRRLAARGPLLVTIDDAERLDPASATVLDAVANRLSGTSVTLLLALTSGAPSPGLGDAFEEWAIGPLDAGDAGRLLGTVGVELAPLVRARILAEAAGNPLALVEMTKALSEAQCHGLSPLPMPLPIGERLSERLTRLVTPLPPRTRECLLHLALSPSGLVSDLPDVADVGEVIGPAEAASVVTVEGPHRRIAFRHPLMASALSSTAPSHERRKAHRTLADAASTPELRIWHRAHGTPEPDDDLAAQLAAFADTLHRRGDHASAADHLWCAVAVTDRAPDRAELMARLAQLHVDTGDLRSAWSLLDNGSYSSTDTSLAAATAVASAGLAEHGECRAAAELVAQLLVSALATPPAAPPVASRAVDALIDTVLLHGGASRPTHIDEVLTTVSGVASTAPMRLAMTDPVRASAADLAALDTTLAQLARERDAREVVRIAESAVFVDRVTDCRPEVTAMLRRSRSDADVVTAGRALHLLAADAFRTGEWDDAEAYSGEGLELVVPRALGPLARHLVHVKALVAAGRGDSERAERLAADLSRWAEPRRLRALTDRASQVRTLCALGRGDFDGAYHETLAVNAPGELPVGAPVVLWLLLDFVEAAVRTDRLTSAIAHVEAMSAAGVAELSPRLSMIVAACAALIDPGERSLAAFEDALHVPGTDRWPFDRARVQLLYGERLRRARLTTEARRPLATARATFERIGARPWAERAGAELRAAGTTLATAAGPLELTPQEFEIASLAATGLSNKEIAGRLMLSHRTIGAHLYRIFPKLGITSRAALRDALDAGAPGSFVA